MLNLFSLSAFFFFFSLQTAPATRPLFIVTAFFLDVKKKKKTQPKTNLAVCEKADLSAIMESMASWKLITIDNIESSTLTQTLANYAQLVLFY